MIIKKDFPQYIKYMGSKTKLVDFILEAINDVYDGGGICDLFAGSCSLSGAIRDQVPVFSNDIQVYSEVIADAYLNLWQNGGFPSSKTILKQAAIIVEESRANVPQTAPYDSVSTLDEFNAIESVAKNLISQEFESPFHLFTKNFSGTWWSIEQCLWIDAIKQVSEEYIGHACYSHLIASLMHAMAYCSQGTGHYAQYRDAKTMSSMRDILIYRKRSISKYFTSKYNDVLTDIAKIPPQNEHVITSLDYKERLESLPRCTVYADPPYCFVHYSRFYHAIETLVRYDYPEIQKKGANIVKGRYRVGRHQSPFCIRTKVATAFNDLFEGVTRSNSNLILSYSDTGMIDLETLQRNMEKSMPGYVFSEKTMNHDHMTMGRQGDRTRKVKEMLLIAKHS